MEIIITRPYDDENLLQAYAVQHDSKETFSPNLKTKKVRVFETDWETALAKAKQADPENRDVTKVIEDLKSMGWRIIKLNNVTITY